MLIRRLATGLLVVVMACSLVVGVPHRPAEAQEAEVSSSIIVLDLSGSMAGPRLDAAKAALSNLASGLSAGEVNLGLRGFTNCAISTEIVPLGPVDPAGFAAAVDGLEATGPNTDISTAMTAAAGALPDGGSIVLVSDGAHNCGPPEPCDAARAIAATGREVRVDTVSFQIADPAAAEELRCVARVTGGRNFPVDDDEALDEAIRRGVVDPPPPPPTPVPDRLERDTGNVASPFVATVADPVQVSSGNFTDLAVDLGFGSSVYGMDLVRSYNSVTTDPAASSDPQGSALGAGWRLGHQITAVTEADGRVAVTLGSGRIVRFEPDGAGGFVRPASFFGELVRAADGGLRVELFNGERWFFTGDRVTRLVSADSGSVDIDHGPDGRITGVRSSTGVEYRLGYDNEGLVVEIEAVVDGVVDRSVRYGYDGDGDLAEVTDAAGGVTRYETDLDGRVTSKTDPTGVTQLTMTYDGQGRVATQTTATGERSEFTYDTDSTGNVSVTTLTVTAEVGDDGSTRTDVYRYGSDAGGYTVSLTDPLGSEVEFERNADGLATRGADRRATGDGAPVGSTVEQSYDAFGNVASETLPGVGTWTYTYSHAATDPEGEEVTLHRLVSSTGPNGGVTEYTYEGLNTVPSRITGPEGLEVTNTIVDGLVTETTDGDGVTTVFSYDRFRRLSSVTDGVGNRTTMVYDAAGRPTRIIDPSGAATVMTYDAEDRLLSVTDRVGAVTTRSYDQAGRITAFADALDTAPGIDSRRSLTYDDAGLLASITDQRGNATTYGYNGFGQLTNSTAPGGASWRFEFSELGRLDSATGPAGDDRAIELAHDVEGLLAGVEAPDGSIAGVEYDDADRPVQVTDRNGIVSTFSYAEGEGGQLVAERYAVGTRDEATIGYTYDEQYRVTEVAGPLPGQVVAYGYTPGGRVASVTDANGNTVAFDYDAAGRVVSVNQPGGRVARYHYDPNGRVVAVTTPEGLRYQTAYDPEGRIVELVSPAGVVTRFTYAANGAVTSATLGGGCEAGGEPVVCPQVDFGETRLLSTPGGTRRSPVVPIEPIDGVYDITLVSSDARHGRLPAQNQPNEQWVLEGLDVDGAVVFTTEPSDDLPDHLTTNWSEVGRYDMGGVVAVRARHAHSLGQRDYNSIDPAGVVFTGPGGQTRTFDVDALALNGATDPDGGTVEYDYDGRYNLTRWVDQNGNATTNAYNPSDELIAVTDPLGRATTRTYDDLGRPATVTDPSGRSFTARYDTGDRHVATVFADGSSQAFEYDNRNRITAEVDLAPDGTERARTSYTYDAASNVTSVTEADGDIIGYAYDLVGNRTQLTYPDGSTVAYTYDELNRLTSAAHSTHGQTTYRYDDDSRITTIEFPDGDERTYDYTGELLTGFTDGDRHWSLSYDGRGRVDEITGSEHWRFAYGNDGQLTQATRDNRSWAYSYDAVGNLTEVTDSDDGGHVSRFSHDPANQIVGDDPSTPGVDRWAHDEAGRLTRSTTGGPGGGDGGVTTEYGYDVRGRLETVVVSGAGGDDTWTRTYGPDDLLATVTNTGPDGETTTWELTWDRTAVPARPLGWTGPDDVALVHGIGPALGIVGDKATRVEMGPLGDVTGSPVAVADHYAPYGTPERSTTGVGVTGPGFGLGYRGELHVGPTINLKVRDLNPALGRFLSPDPLPASAGAVATSRYAYAANDPINLIDPLGLAPTDNFARFLEDQINQFSLADFAVGVGGYAWDAIKGVLDLGKLAWSGMKCQASTVSRFVTFGRYEVGSCDEIAALRDGVVELGQTIFSAVRANNVSALLDVLSTFMPDRCAFDYDTFELDYCAGQATAALVVAVATGGAGASANLSRLGRIADRLPTAVDDAVDSARRFFPESAPVCPTRTGRSFAGHTLVLLANGTTKPIAEVDPGDLVLATDPHTGETGVEEVTHVWVHLDRLARLDLEGGGSLVTTEDHPFWNVTDRAWQRADHLDPGDQLHAPGGTVTVVGLAPGSARIDQAYNLTTTGPHTYYVVGDDQPALVHNTNPERGPCGITPHNAPRTGGVAGTAARNADELLTNGRQVRGNFPNSASPNEVLYRAGSDGSVTYYQVYDDLGRPVMRVDLVGRAHGGIPTPHVQEYVLNTNPATGQTFVNKGPVRAALPEEIPS